GGRGQRERGTHAVPWSARREVAPWAAGDPRRRPRPGRRARPRAEGRPGRRADTGPLRRPGRLVHRRPAHPQPVALAPRVPALRPELPERGAEDPAVRPVRRDRKSTRLTPVT